jgi:hypothetical protein
MSHTTRVKRIGSWITFQVLHAQWDGGLKLTSQLFRVRAVRGTSFALLLSHDELIFFPDHDQFFLPSINALDLLDLLPLYAGSPLKHRTVARDSWPLGVS